MPPIHRGVRKLRKERHRFQQGDLELKNAVTNISHDLRTPLTAISGYLDLLDNAEKSEEAERYIKVIRNRTEVTIKQRDCGWTLSETIKVVERKHQSTASYIS